MSYTSGRKCEKRGMSEGREYGATAAPAESEAIAETRDEARD